MFPSYAAGDHNDVLDTLERRPAPWYEHCVGPLIRALAGERISTPFFLSARRSGFNNEWTETVLRDRLQIRTWLMEPIKPTGPAPLHIAETLRSFVEYERIAAAAVIGRDLSLLEKAIGMHPWTGDHSVVWHIQREIKGQTSATFGV